MFLAYTKHEQEKEDIIQMILKGLQAGVTEMSFKLEDSFSNSDIEHIKKEIYQRWEAINH